MNMNYSQSWNEKPKEIYQTSDNILHTPYSQGFSYNNREVSFSDISYRYIIKEPISFQDYIRRYFYKSYPKYKKCKFLIEECKKKFYYSIEIAFSQIEDSIILFCFSNGIWMPIFPKNKSYQNQKDYLDSVQNYNP